MEVNDVQKESVEKEVVGEHVDEGVTEPSGGKSAEMQLNNVGNQIALEVVDSSEEERVLKQDSTKRSFALWEISPTMLSWCSLDAEKTNMLVSQASTLLSIETPESTKRALAYLRKVLRSSENIRKHEFIKYMVLPERLVCTENMQRLVLAELSLDILLNLAYDLMKGESSALEGDEQSQCECYLCALKNKQDIDSLVVLSLLLYIGIGCEPDEDDELISKLLSLGMTEFDNLLATTEFCALQINRSDFSTVSPEILEALQKAVAAENTRAMVILGQLYEQGRVGDGSTASRTEMATQFFQQAAELGDSQAMCHLACIFEESNDFESSTKWLLAATSAGNSFAQFTLGMRMLNGDQHEKGLVLLGYAAAAGELEAYNHVITAYSQGTKSIKPNPVRALQWRIQAALDGEPEEQTRLAEDILYESQNGLAQPSHIATAEHHVFLWFERAAIQGNSRAMLQIATSYSQGTLGVTKDTEKAFMWASKSAECNLPEACLLLGHMHFSGIGTEKNSKTGVDFIKKAAAMGNPKGIYMLSQLHRVPSAADFGLVHDAEIAMDLLKKAAKKDFPEAQYMLGQHFLQIENMDKALVWFRRAAMKGHLSSMFNTAMFYQQGWGVEQNVGASFVWMAKAAASGHKDAAGMIRTYHENPQVKALIDKHQALLHAISLHPTLHGVYRPLP